MRRFPVLMLIVGMVVTLGSGYAMAYSGRSYYSEGSMNGVRYLTGGVGLSERTHMREMAKDYNVKMIFAYPSGAYLANVRVEIQNNAGKNLIQTYSNGPWFLAELPAGQYTITVTHDGMTKTRKLAVGQVPQEEMFHFKA